MLWSSTGIVFIAQWLEICETSLSEMFVVAGGGGQVPHDDEDEPAAGGPDPPPVQPDRPAVRHDPLPAAG